MSHSRYAIIPARAIDDRAMPETALMVLLVLGTYVNNEGWVNIDSQDYAAQLHVSIGDIEDSITYLEQHNYIKFDGKIGEIAFCRIVMDVPLRCSGVEEAS